MSGTTRKAGEVAFMEEADDDGNVMEGAPKVAASVGARSPTKAKHSPNTSKSRRGDSAADTAHHTDTSSASSDGSTAHPRASERRDSRLKPSSRDVTRVSPKKAVAPARPPLSRHHRTSPTVQTGSSGHRRARDDPSNYGIDREEGGAPVIVPHTSRPRARTDDPNRRHSSYYTADPSRPPLASARFSHMPPPPPPMVAPMAPPPFPPPQTWIAPPPPPPPPRNEMFALPLAGRFDRGVERPSSAMAQHRPARYEEYEQPERMPQVTRRPSARKQREEDSARMPPPQRPSSAMPSTAVLRPGPFAPPPQPRPQAVHRRSQNYDENPFQPDPISPYAVAADEGAPLAMYEYSIRQRRPSVSYDHGGHHRTEVAAPSSRRNSYYGGSLGIGIEDKMAAANAYQNNSRDDRRAPLLTREALHRQNRTGGSSQSTRSSASRDESDYRQSATTTTTPSSRDITVDDDVTIMIKGAQSLKIGGAEVECFPDAEINVRRLNATGGSSGATVRGFGGGGSDRSSYIDADERRAARDRPSHRRAASQTPYNRHLLPAYFEPPGPTAIVYHSGYGAPFPPPPPPPGPGYNYGGYV